MKCPNCETPEKTRLKVCPACGEAFANEDILAYHQLEYLVDETASWESVQKDRELYIEKLKKLRSRLRGIPDSETKPFKWTDPAPVSETPQVIPEVAQPAATAPAIETPVGIPEAVKPPAEPKPPKEKVPFDQWLLSERNIKIALYTGGLLLVIAGLIFIGVNWTRIPGPGKFAITSLITGLMYLGGYLLFQREAYRIGGVALLGVASGFLTLNFAVLQIYVLGPGGLRDDIMWLIASPLCLLFYVLTAYWTRSELFTYISIAAVISTITAFLVTINTPLAIYSLSYAVLFLILLLANRWFQTTRFEDFTALPLLYTAHIGIILVISFSFGIENAWLYTAPIVVLFYLLATFWTQASIFTYLSMATVISMTAAIMVFLESPLLVFTLVFAVLMIAFLSLGYGLRKTKFADFTLQPLQVGSQIGTVIVLISTLALWNIIGADDHSWVPILTFGLGALFYILTDLFFQWLAARWASALLFALTLIFVLDELDSTDSTTGIVLMLLSLAYLGIGYFLEQRAGKRSHGWPLYGIAYLIAVIVTVLSVPELDDLILVLFGDVLLLGVSAVIHRDYKWVYGAAWLFMLPVYLIIYQIAATHYQEGIVMGILGLNYLIAGYLLGRRELHLGGPFLTAAAFLSLLVIILSWNNPLVTSIMLAVIAVLYLLSALWLDWTVLLIPALASVEFLVLSISYLDFKSFSEAFIISLVISYAVLGIVLVLGALGLRRSTQSRWAWPLYLVGVINLGATYIPAFYFGGWLMIWISLSLSLLLLGFSWYERKFLQQIKAPPLLTYLAIGVIFILHFFLLEFIFPNSWEKIWPFYSAALCAVFVAAAWFLRNPPYTAIYSAPFHLSGLLLTAIPLIGSLMISESIPIALAFGIAGITFIVDAALRRILALVYTGIAAFIVVIWAVLAELGVSEPQAYTIPAGAALLGIGWNERIRGGGLKYTIPTILGLFILMGSAFFQSLLDDGLIYAIILLGESLLAVYWGIRTHSRGYVQLGVIAIVANAVMQLGPGFIDLPRWIQIGLTGIILFGGGMGAMFKRDAILETREKITQEWRSWES
ncbi:MAG: hypothetical protein ABFS17_12645 [Chloroflexota bacterium]